MRKLNIPANELLKVKTILARIHGMSLKISCFGSRATGKAKPFSDLDICIMGQSKIDVRLLGDLKEAFEESSLPFTVDLIDYHRISNDFQIIIDKDGIILTP